MSAPGVFTISLDFELHWGGFEKWPLSQYKTYFLNTRSVIPNMLASFLREDVHATWACVGMLLHESKDELVANAPAVRPTYANMALSAYNYIDRNGIGENENADPFHFAPSLIRKIKGSPGQEIGTHTFSHYYCNESGQTHEQFRNDLASAKRASQKYGCDLRSLVFPRNQFNEDYLRVCFEEGIQSVRSNPGAWFWKIGSTESEPFSKRLVRGMDAYFSVGPKTSYKLSDVNIAPGLPLRLPASRLLRPYRPSEFLLNDLKLATIRREMEHAAKSGEVYHLWWHPHNFGNHPKESMLGLDKILAHYRYCRQHYGMRSLNMMETANLLLSA